MHATKISEHVSLIDLETGGLENFIASYVLEGKQAAIIETGPTSSIPNLLLGLRKLDVKPENIAYVAVSHIHLDHGGGVGTLLKHLPNAKVVVHQRGAQHLANPERLWQQSQEVLGRITDLYGEPEPVPVEKIVPVTDRMAFDLGNNVTLQVIETLGHASHHQSYFENPGRGLFPGDAAGIYLKEYDVTVPTTPAPFRLDSALSSLDKLIALNPRILFYSHFGPATDSIGKLEAYKDQLELWARIADEGVAQGQSMETIRERIFQADLSVRKAEELVKSHPILSETVLGNSIQGFVDLARSRSDNK